MNAAPAVPASSPRFRRQRPTPEETAAGTRLWSWSLSRRSNDNGSHSTVYHRELRFREVHRRASAVRTGIDQRGDLVVDGIERIGFEQCRLADPEAENLQAVALLAQFSDFVLAAIELGVARMVAVEAAGIDLDRAGAAACAGALDGLARR